MKNKILKSKIIISVFLSFICFDNSSASALRLEGVAPEGTPEQKKK
jgi:hypothetical protein